MQWCHHIECGPGPLNLRNLRFSLSKNIYHPGETQIGLVRTNSSMNINRTPCMYCMYVQYVSVRYCHDVRRTALKIPWNFRYHSGYILRNELLIKPNNWIQHFISTPSYGPSWSLVEPRRMFGTPPTVHSLLVLSCPAKYRVLIRSTPKWEDDTIHQDMTPIVRYP